MGALRTFVRLFVLGRRRGLRSRVRRRVWSMVGFGDQQGATVDHAGMNQQMKNAEDPADIPDGYRPVAMISDLPPGTLMEVFVDDHAIALGNVDGTLYAIGNTCPHAGGPLGDGSIEGTQAVCPYHGWAFDLASGVCNLNENVNVPTYGVRAVSGQICVQI